MDPQKNDSLLSAFELDQLKEAVNIGASHASTALSQMINKKTIISIPEVYISAVNETMKYVENGEKFATSVIVKILGEATGLVFFLFPENNGVKLARLVSGVDDKGELLTDIDRSALQEVGNILSGACLTALSKFLGISLLHSVSEIITDLLISIINSLMVEVRKTSEFTLIFKVDMKINEENIQTQMFFLMDQEFTERVLNMTQKNFVK